MSTWGWRWGAVCAQGCCCPAGPKPELWPRHILSWAEVLACVNQAHRGEPDFVVRHPDAHTRW